MEKSSRAGEGRERENTRARSSVLVGVLSSDASCNYIYIYTYKHIIKHDSSYVISLLMLLLLS
jgi:hypothetical protein